jgi:hypothetical protein
LEYSSIQNHYVRVSFLQLYDLLEANTKRLGEKDVRLGGTSQDLYEKLFGPSSDNL